MSLSEERLCDTEGFAALLAAMAGKIAEGRRQGFQLGLVGIRTRGYPIAVRLSTLLKSLTGEDVPVGAVDITLYRDDLDGGERWPVLKGTAIPFPVDDAEIILVDDVLYSGRTVRAALNAVCDLGRPARVRLAALVDRGHREIPIQPDVVGLTVETTPDEAVRVRVTPIDSQDEIVRIRSKSPS